MDAYTFIKSPTLTCPAWHSYLLPSDHVTWCKWLPVWVWRFSSSVSLLQYCCWVLLRNQTCVSIWLPTDIFEMYNVCRIITFDNYGHKCSTSDKVTKLLHSFTSLYSFSALNSSVYYNEKSLKRFLFKALISLSISFSFKRSQLVSKPFAFHIDGGWQYNKCSKT